MKLINLGKMSTDGWMYASMHAYMHICIYTIHQSINLSIYRSIYQSINLSIYQSINQSINLSIYLSIHPSIYLSIYLSLSLSLSVSVYGKNDLQLDFMTNKNVVFINHHSKQGRDMLEQRSDPTSV